MAIAIPLRALLPYALGAATYLFRTLLPEAPPTQAVGVPYTPPFLGAQCNTAYNFSFTQTAPPDAPTFYDGTRSRVVDRLDIGNTAYGRVIGVDVGAYGGYAAKLRVAYMNSSGVITYQVASTGGADYGSVIYTYTNVVFTRADGQPDDCGNLSNPIPNKPVSESGVADSGSPNLENNPIVQAGVPVLAIPSFMSALLAALNAAKSASDALAAVRAIAEAIEAIADLLNALKDKADKDKKKDDPNNKEITRNDFGSIRFDGYLRLYPSTGTNEREAIYIDLQLLSIPIWYGKYFGRSSPNFYRFKSLGYISFTSPTFGIIETKEIEFSRMSLNVPSNASGFFYHLGLEGDIVGNISAFYQKPK